MLLFRGSRSTQNEHAHIVAESAHNVKQQVMHLESGRCRYWIYREGIFGREVEKFRWFLHGLFA